MLLMINRSEMLIQITHNETLVLQKCFLSCNSRRIFSKWRPIQVESFINQGLQIIKHFNEAHYLKTVLIRWL